MIMLENLESSWKYSHFSDLTNVQGSGKTSKAFCIDVKP